MLNLKIKITKNHTHNLSPDQARLLVLHCQGLMQPVFGKGKNGALGLIKHLGYIQLDTLSVIARAHHHTLWTRLPDYKETFLNDLLEKDQDIFEYWSHAASYLPMSDYRFSLAQKREFEAGKSHWFAQDKKTKKYVLDRIKAEGPLQSKDFEYKRNVPGNWYEWKPAKQALEQLFMEGKLMVSKRQGFQKVYDVTERVLPANIDTSMPTDIEYTEYLIKSAVRSHGIVEEKEIGYMRTGLKYPINKVLKKMLLDGVLKEISIQGLEKSVFLSTDQHLKTIEKIKQKNTIHFLSPFDNAIIQRKRLSNIFNFKYVLECYLPQHKRKYGYFTLPVLYGDKFIGRFDPKADRSSKTFHINTMHFENGFKPDDDFNETFTNKLKTFAAFNACDKIVIAGADKAWIKAVKKNFSI